MSSFATFARAVVCTALVGPFLGAASSPDVSATITAMNREGLARFAAASPPPVPPTWGNFAGGDLAVSPLLLSFAQAIHSPGNEALPSLLARLRRSGVTIDASVAQLVLPPPAHPTPTPPPGVIRSFITWELPTPSPETAERWRALGVTFTTFPPPTPRPDHFVQLSLMSSIDVIISSDDPLAVNVYPTGTKLPFWSFQGVRAVRLDTKRGLRSLFLFWGTRGALDALRTHLTPERWNEISTDFIPSLVAATDAGIDTVGYHSTRGSGGDDVQDARLLASRDHVSIHLDDRTTRWQGMMNRDWANLPVPEVLTTAPPFLYVVVDDDTGVILLLGEHL